VPATRLDFIGPVSTRTRIFSLGHEWNEAAQTWRSAPVHDHASHGADAARYLALGVRESEAKPIEQQFPSSRTLYERGTNISWMSV
jgi:hypothetical protein